MRPPLVLLAIADEDARTIYSLYLAHAGLSVLAVDEAGEALVLAAARSPDVVVAAVALRGADGFALTERLRADPATRAIPVVLVATWDSLVDRLRAQEVGASAFRCVPFPPGVLLDDVRRLAAPGMAPLE